MNSIKEEVTQADREMAAEYVFTMDYSNPEPNLRERWQGLGAELPIVQAFARHRIQSTSDLRAKAEGLAEALRKAADKIDAASTAAVKQDCLPLAEALHNVEVRLRQALSEWDQSQ